MSVIDDATFWCRLGFYPIPVPYREKGPKLEDWPKLRITTSDVPRYFNGEPQNLGVLLGEPYGNADVDLDCNETLRAWPHLGPDTGLIFGRRSKPRSHWMYRADPACRSRKYTDPVNGGTLIELRCLKADGTVGLQTIVPGSVHPSGELIEFAPGCNREPENVDAEELDRAVRQTAAVALLARHWPSQGSRHTAFLALAGGLKRKEWAFRESTRFLSALYAVLWPENPDYHNAEREVDSTYQADDDGKKITGLKTLRKFVTPVVVDQIAKWLGLPDEAEPSKSSRQQDAAFTFTSLRDLLAEPEEIIDWVLEDMLPAGGISLFAGKPKSGKSTLARGLAVAIARGEQFLGRTTTKGPVLYLGLEEKRSEVRKHFHALGASGEEGIHVHIAPAPVQAIAAAQRAIAQYQPVLVIIDPLLRFTRVKDANDYAQVNNALEPVLTLARESGAHLMLVYHSGKSDKADLVDSALGSTAFAGSVDTLLVYKRTERYRILATVQRYGPELPETVIEWDAERRSVSLGTERSKAETERLKTEILSHLKPGTGLTEDQICEAVEGKQAIKRSALRELLKEGKLSREGAGKRGDPYIYKWATASSGETL